MMASVFGELGASERHKARAPVVRADVNAVCARIWGELPLAGHMGRLERLLMIDADAPVQFDCVLSRPSKERSVVLVEGVRRSLKANRDTIRPIVEPVLDALKLDRLERNGKDGDAGIEADFESMTRTVEVNTKPAWRPRGD